jgi:hypothetical protein
MFFDEENNSLMLFLSNQKRFCSQRDGLEGAPLVQTIKGARLVGKVEGLRPRGGGGDRGGEAAVVVEYPRCGQWRGFGTVHIEGGIGGEKECG